jgi:hypothetical protein
MVQVEPILKIGSDMHLSVNTVIDNIPKPNTNPLPTNAVATPTASTCILFRFAPEIRKNIFQAILSQFFEEHPEHAELRFIGSYQEESIAPVSQERFFGGLREVDVPDFEHALAPEPILFREFVTTRLDATSLILAGESDFADRKPDKQLWDSQVHYPSLKVIPSLLKAWVKVVVFEIP